MTTPPQDTGLGARWRANAFIRESENRVSRTWFSALTRWLDRVRPDVLQDDRVDPGSVSNHSAFWGRLMQDEVVPEVGNIFTRVRNRVTQRREPVTDPAVAAYLNQVGNRLVRLPDEVYALIVTELERGLAEGESIPDISARVQKVLTATGSERWPNRAVTVARTETIGAVNAGAFNGAMIQAERDGDLAPFKVWLATDDTRTRPTHDEADGQRTLLSEPFVVGGSQLLFPGDPAGPANEVINCRCTFLPIVLGETLDWTSRQNP